MTISPSGFSTGTAGELFTLECSADILTQTDTPFPTFEWFFCLTNTSLPSGVTVSNVTNSGNTYTSTLQFSPLQGSHAGMYTCRLGGNERLAVNSMISKPKVELIVNEDILVAVITSSYKLHSFGLQRTSCGCVC